MNGFSDQPATAEHECTAFVPLGVRACRLTGGRKLLGVLAVLHCLASASAAQTSLLTAELASSTQGVRSSAPATLVWKLNSQAPGILEGRFVLTVFDDREIVGRVITDDVILGAGEQQQRIMLPAFEVNSPSQSAELKLSFVGKQKTIDLGTFSVRFAGSWDRYFTLCVCDPWSNASSGARQALIGSLRFESYNPEAGDRSVTTLMIRPAPAEMPQQALGYCAYDLVVLVQDGFSELRNHQLDALASWIEAGGSALILPATARPDPAHVEFLNRLFKAPEQEPRFFTDPSGRLAASAESIDANVHFVRHGLGRVIVATGNTDPLAQADSVLWRRVCAFLWRLRHDQSAEFISRAKWNAELLKFDPDRAVHDVYGISRIRPSEAVLAPIALQTGDQLLQHLLPHDLRVLPLSLVGLLLFGYVLVIGPGDYFLLGAIRRRKWTWGLFPAVTVGCAWVVVSLAHWYMAVRDDRAAVTFLDIGDDNRVVRSNRFEVLFSGAERTATTEVQQGILTAMNHQQFGGSTWHLYQNAQVFGNNADARFKLVGAPEVSGRFPSRYVVTQHLPQWTPQLNRVFQLGDQAAANDDFDWNQFADADVYHPGTLRQGDVAGRIVGAVQKKFGRHARVFLFWGANSTVPTGGSGVLFDPPPDVAAPYARRTVQTMDGQPVSADFLRDTCVFNDSGLFKVVSQISPTGGRNFEDLSLLDPSDPGQWLLVVAVERGGDMLIYRKLYMGAR